MSQSSFSSAQIRSQVRTAVDPSGEHVVLLESIDPRQAENWVTLLGQKNRALLNEFRSLSVEYKALLESMEDSLMVLVPRGWAPFNMDSDVVRQAIELARSSRGEADELLSGQWDGDGGWRTKRVCDRVRNIGAGFRQRDFEELFQQRARLLVKAREHHEAGRYDASIPILHAQMEGIVIDVTGGKKFFTKGAQKADVIDPRQLVSIEACLAALQAKFGEGVAETQAKGSISRHGIAHGRELAYDTRANSAKSWSVVDAIVEWALPLGRAEAERRLAERQAANAGSEEVDERGRRVDDREFSQTRDVLILLGHAAIGHHRNLGHFRSDLVDGVYTQRDFTKRGLPAPHGVHMEISGGGRIAWFWRRTISGWVLAYAVSDDGRGMQEWFYSGSNAPSGPPSETPGWSDVFVREGDWA